MEISSSGKLEQFAGPILVFSHLRWNFVFQRPQHLLSRFSRRQEVFFFEEPVFEDGVAAPALATQRCPVHARVTVVTPQLPAGLGREACNTALEHLLNHFIADKHLSRPICWYYTPAMLPFSRGIQSAAVVYDCMDELANFRFAAPELPLLERELLQKADVVFTGGYSLYEQKRPLHPHVHAFPSGVDTAHFARARGAIAKPLDQEGIPRPRLGFYGVIDERIDFALLGALADAHPEWSLVMIGPLAKVGEDEIAKRPNIHYLGGKAYSDLPAYLSGWDVGLMPFAINEATRFISPTKTPEYLAGGVPVVSTAIRDVARQYESLNGVYIGETTADFIAGCEEALRLKHGSQDWLADVDALLENLSWDRTFDRMQDLVQVAVKDRARSRIQTAAA